MECFLNDVWLILLIQVPLVLIMPNLFVAIAVVCVVYTCVTCTCVNLWCIEVRVGI